MKKAVVFTFEDYWKALDGAGPKTKENILCRAENDPKDVGSDCVDRKGNYDCSLCPVGYCHYSRFLPACVYRLQS